MLALDETAVVCDLAQTYGVLHYRGLPVQLIAALASGLGEDSRIRRKMAGINYPLDTLILAGMADRLSMLCWFQSTDGQSGINRPKSLLSTLMGNTSGGDNAVFDSPEAFEAAKAKILEV